jgi:hypothetical protein
LDVITLIAERRIKEAMDEGALDDLPGAGRPLPDDDLANLPAESRLALRILRSAGHQIDPAHAGNVYLSAEPDLLEAGRLARKMTRLRLALEKRPKGRRPSGGPVPGGPGPYPEGPGPDPEGPGPAISDSPYLPLVLERIGGRPGANPPGANAQGANPPRANAPGVNPPGANAPGANHPGANQPGANPPGANAPGANPENQASDDVFSSGHVSSGHVSGDRVSSATVSGPGAMVDWATVHEAGPDGPGRRSPRPVR